MTGVLRLALAGALLGTSLVAVAPAASSARQPAGGAARTVRAPRTRVSITVRGCRDCSVRASRYLPAEGGQPWYSHRRTVDASGRVAFVVPTARTPGLTFLVDAPWHGADGVAAVMAARYRGFAVGERVDDGQAAQARRGEACWAGTTDQQARIVIRVARFRSRTLTGSPTWHPRAWAVRGLATTPPMSVAPHGSIGTQYAIGCSVPGAARNRDRRAGVTGLTVRVPRCSGCRVTLGQWVDPTRAPWRSATRTVAGGRARFDVRSARTRGMFVALTAPWEEVTGYQTFAVFRYGDHRPGDRVGFTAARRQTQGSACWAGTRAAHRTITLAAREVRVLAPTSGQHVRGTLAWVPRQQRTVGEDRPVDAGVLGSEEAIACGPTAPSRVG